MWAGFVALLDAILVDPVKLAALVVSLIALGISIDSSRRSRAADRRSKERLSRYKSRSVLLEIKDDRLTITNHRDTRIDNIVLILDEMVVAHSSLPVSFVKPGEAVELKIPQFRGVGISRVRATYRDEIGDVWALTDGDLSRYERVRRGQFLFWSRLGKLVPAALTEPLKNLRDARRTRP